MPQHDVRHANSAALDLGAPNWIELSDSAVDSITELIAQAQGGQAASWDHVYSALYKELHVLARQQIRKHSSGAGSGRSPTSLVSRVWLRLSPSQVVYENRRHLIGILVRAMRFALVDEVRQVCTAKRSAMAGEALVAYDADADIAFHPELEHLLTINQALNTLAEAEPRLGQVVEMRFFAGMNDAEIAALLGVTPRTVHRDWVRARAFLASELGEPDDKPLPG